MTTKMLQISGESGGGQLLRSSLSLSLVTGQPFRMVNIRGQRPKPGLMRQHLTCVKAAAQISNAVTDGAEIGSTELVFSPGKVVPGDYHFNIGSGGSTTLVLQTLLPPLLLASAASSLTIEGGTHNPMAPPFEFIEQCFLPALRLMGMEASVTLQRPGFMQAGGGILQAVIQPTRTMKKLHLTERGELLGIFGKLLHAHLPSEIITRLTAPAKAAMEPHLQTIELQHARESLGPGAALMLGARYANVGEISTGFAQQGVTAESIGHSTAKSLLTYLASSAPVGRRLADQLLLPMALAGGGVFHTLPISDHTRTNIELIQRFLSYRLTVEELPLGVRAIHCQ